MRRITIKQCLVMLLFIFSSNISTAQDCLDTESYYQYIKYMTKNAVMIN